MARDSTARFAADAASLALGAVSAVVTARLLGPADRGVYVVVLLVTTLTARLATLGLGEATVVLVSRGQARRPEAVACSIAATLASSLVGVAILVGVLDALVEAETGQKWLIVTIAAATVPLAALATLMSYFLLLDQRVVRASQVGLAASLAATASIVLLLVVLDAGLPGAVASTVVTAIVAIAVAFQKGMLRAPLLHAEFFRRAISYGLRIETGYLLTHGAARLDVLLVFALLDERQAGIYSIALTVAVMINAAPAAVAFAAFPRLARSSAETGLASTAALTRLAVLVAAAMAALATVAIPLVTVPVFGPEYSNAIIPSLILAWAGVPWAAQWMLCRAAAATGNPNLLLISFGLFLLVMTGLDLIAIPTAGVDGAAVASMVAGLAGLGACLAHYTRSGLSCRELVPHRSDASLLQSLALQELRHGRAQSAG